MGWGWIRFSIPEPCRGERKHSTSWIKIISKPKPWEILFITCYKTTFLFTHLSSNLSDAKVNSIAL